MAVNNEGAIGVPLTTLGGWVTEMSPNGLPEGVSPDCQEMMFQPGSAYSRPGFQKVFANPFPTGGPNNFVPTVVTGKSFIASDGTIKNLYFDANGIMWVEDWTNSPGTYTKLFTSIAGSMCRMSTAFGRVFIAISDGLYPNDIAYEWDGTNLDRVTQGGPTGTPTVQSVTLDASTLAVGSGGAVALSTVEAINYSTSTMTYINLLCTLTTPGSLTGGVGTTVQISGASIGAYDITAIVTNLIYSGPTVTQFWLLYQGTTGGTATGASATTVGFTLARGGNVVTGNTAAAHNLKVGYQVQITEMDTLTVGTSVSSITIDNETLPGIATVTTLTSHGLVTGNDVSITGVTPAAVGGGISSISRQGGIVTLKTVSAHGLIPGSVVQVAGVTDGTFDTNATVALVPSPTEITYAQTDTDATSSGGTVSITWPVPDNTPSPTYFTVLAAPTPTTFQVQVNYGNGSWTSGSVTFGWNGRFFVASVPSSTSFTYRQYGPNGSSTTTGKATPYGQCSPGLHLMQEYFLLRNGQITPPGPPVTFVANGGEYVSVSNMTKGNLLNVVARIYGFTGAQPNVPGVFPPFFYLAVPAQLEGQVVSTATQVNDNTSTTAFFDFSDDSLFGSASGGGALSVTGNNLGNQIILDGALGFFYSASRLTTWGQRNTVQQFLNLGFDGGADASGKPTWWDLSSNVGGLLTTIGTAQEGWLIAVPGTGAAAGQISQNAYETPWGEPIIEPNTKYTVRVNLFSNLTATGVTLHFSLTSASTSFSSTATIDCGTVPVTATGPGAFYEAAFSTVMPATIPTDLLLTIWATSSSAAVNLVLYQLQFLYSESPYRDTESYTSYTNNPNGFDGVSGNNGPTDDTRKIMDFSVLRGSIYAHTQDPSGRLHEISINPTSEPSGWNWREVASNCGTLSAFSVTHSQADDESASGAEDWTAWASEGGALIFDGSVPKKISQEIQPNWYSPYSAYPWVEAGNQINLAAAKTITALNDPVEKMLYFFVPINTATAPSRIYPLSYRELQGAYAISNSPPFHPSLGGKLVATDNSRKWTRWMRAMNGAARMYRNSTGELTTVFFGGNGQSLNAAAGYGNIYILNTAKLTDDDYGQIYPYYTTYFFLEKEKAQALGLSAIRLMVSYLNAYVTGTGTMTYTYLISNLNNPWALTTQRTLNNTANFDEEVGGANATGNQIAVKLSSSPASGQTDNGFNVQSFQIWLKKAKISVRGSSQ